MLKLTQVHYSITKETNVVTNLRKSRNGNGHYRLYEVVTLLDSQSTQSTFEASE